MQHLLANQPVLLPPHLHRVVARLLLREILKQQPVLTIAGPAPSLPPPRRSGAPTEGFGGGTPNPSVGTRGYRQATKLKPADIPVIRTSNDDIEVLAARYGVHPRTIEDVQTRRTWRSIPDGV